MPTAFEIADAARAGIAGLLDLQLSPLGLEAMASLDLSAGQSVLDVGCGAGQTVQQLAELVGADGRVVGVDIGARSLAVARARTGDLPHVTLLQDDAAVLAWPDGSFDAVYSRFGVMFFDDPVTAFCNLRRMTRRGGRIGFVCWRSWRENELDYLPVEAAGLNIAVDATPFSFSQPEHVRNILRSSGFDQVSVRAFDASVSCGDADDTVEVLTKVGALGKVLRERPELMPVAKPRVRDMLLARCRDDHAELGAATWIVSAVAK